MKLQHSLFAAQALFFLFGAVPTTAQSITIQEFADSFRSMGFTTFADIVGQSPEIQDGLSGKDASNFDLSVAIPENNQAPPLDTSGRRRQNSGSLIVALHMSNTPRRARKRDAKPVIPTGVRETWLKSPKVVNLGCDVGQTTVNKRSGQYVEVAVGMGKTVNSTGKVVKFKYGTIYEVKRYVPFPQPR